MKKYLFFDLDGTLLNTAKGITTGIADSIRETVGITEKPENLLSFIGPPLYDEFIRVFNITPAQADETVRVYRKYYADVGMYLNSPYHGIFEAIQKLKRIGYVPVVATSKPTVYSLQMLEAHGALSLFRMVSGTTIGNHKETKADVIRNAINSLGVDPTDAYMIGDRKFDMLGGIETGLAPLGVSYGFGSYEELKNAGAHKIFDSPSALRTWLEKQAL